MASERKFVAENVRRVLLKEYLMKEVSRAGFGGLDVQRTPMGTSVVLATERPGLVIGRRGQTIKTLTAVIEDRFGFENPQIEVHEVENANLNAQIMAEKLAFSLERGWHFRRAGHSSVRRIMESGAKGCHIIISGKLTGQRHRTEKFKDGYIKFCGDPKLRFMERGYAVAKLKQGIVGVTVEIMAPGARLPADITVMSKTDAANVLPDLIEKPAEAVETMEKPKKAAGKKDAAEPVAEPVAEPAAETVEAEKPKKVAKKKAEPVAEPVAEAATEAVEKPKKTVKKKAEPAAEAEAVTEAPAEKPKKVAKKKAEPVAEPAAETVETAEKPKKVTKKKAEPAAEAEAATEAPAEKPKKVAKKKAEPVAESETVETAEKPKRATKKKTEEASE